MLGRNQRFQNSTEKYYSFALAMYQKYQELCRKYCIQAYFCEALLPVRALFDKTSMPLDNKELRKQLNERLQALDDALWIKESLLDAMRTEKFTVTDYLKRKAKVMLSLEGETASSGSSTARGTEP